MDRTSNEVVLLIEEAYIDETQMRHKSNVHDAPFLPSHCQYKLDIRVYIRLNYPWKNCVRKQQMPFSSIINTTPLQLYSLCFF